jgi:hypothetical protein
MLDPNGSAVAAEQRADQSVSIRFTRLMNASTSPLGVLTDPPIVALASGTGFIAFLGVLSAGAGETAVRALGAAALLPIAVALVLSVALLGARRGVVAWLSRQPFPIENMNAVLNGLGESLEVTFAGAMPATPELNAQLDTVNPDAFVMGSVEDARTLDIRIGVVDSKRNPAVTNHRRYVRVRELVERVLVPLAERYPIASVRVK